MKQVGVYNAKTHFTQLLDEVERGETIEITRHGKPVARLTPLHERRRRTPAEAVEALLAFREEHSLDGLTVRELIDEGRRI